ncbi:bifunctional diaminohydroxyphosphoribosylaminopyrimidine deaminase/5-amino-6-(5-phosphoribosylamino)uracil reductase RibD [Actinoallomurus vinaceus]|uniref:Riboflavin biosynthesis protein RibD n=1 Tax=Actinoallomurus vinaceus TaxID=1080074 RepID=A0ABP8U6X8_9ACTN
MPFVGMAFRGLATHPEPDEEARVTDHPAQERAMRRALALAVRARGETSPNPVVGCVVLDAAGEVAGEGYHAYAGGPHAEVVALREAAGRARGGTLVVTLEPCDHQGRTGPCTLAVIDAGVARVVYAVADPDPVAGGGARRLAEAGIEVEGGLLAAEAELANAEWLTRTRLNRPHVTWKFAATLDGRSAAADGTSRWITGPEARHDVHELRARCDAIVVGAGTVLADDPRLTVRGVQRHDHLLTSRRPLRVVVDGRARTPLTSRILDDEAPTLIAVGEDADTTALETRTAVVRLPRGDGGLDLAALLAELRDRQIVSVLLEGGPTLAGGFLAAGLVDRVVAYLAPTLLGAGPAALGPAGVGTLAEARHLRIEDITRIGPDLRVTAVPQAAETPTRPVAARREN